MLEPEKTPAQQAALERLETALALVEGWVDHVVDRATRSTLPSSAALREAARRRRAVGGPAEHVMAGLVGLELRPRRLREASRLWEAVEAARGPRAATRCGPPGPAADPGGPGRPGRLRHPAQRRGGRLGRRRRCAGGPAARPRRPGATTTRAAAPGDRGVTPAEADAELAGLRLDGPEQAELRAAYRRHLAAHPGARPGGSFAGSALHRDGPPAHLTASALVLTDSADRALLLLHRKAGAWLQPGGHLEAGDRSLAAAALREAAEETGLGPVLRPAGGLVDLHHHGLGAAFGRCREHLDVAFVLTAPDDAEPVLSAESDRVAWFALDALPEGVAADVPPRLARAAALLRDRRAAGHGPD